MSTVKDEVWTQLDGQQIEVKDMSEAHVRNTLRMLIRKNREQHQRHEDFVLGDIEEGVFRDQQ